MKITCQSINDVKNSTMEVKNATVVNTQAISKLEMQMGQLANHLGERDKGKFPSQLLTNPKACMSGNSSNQEHAHAIVTLRSGKQVDNHVAEPEADLAGKKVKKVKRVTKRRKEMLSHLQSPKLLRNLLGHLYLKCLILRDY